MKTFFFFYFLTFFYIGLSAQKMTIGLRRGIGISAHERIFDPNYGNRFEIKPVISYSGSFDFTCNILRGITFVSGFDFEKKGVQRYAYREHYYYLTAPVNLRCYIIKPERYKWFAYFQGGLYYSRLLLRRETRVGTGALYDIGLPEYLKPVSNDYGLGGAAGGGFKINSKWRFTFQFSFSHGMRDIYFKRTDEWPAPDQRRANVAALFEAGIHYVIKTPANKK